MMPTRCVLAATLLIVAVTPGASSEAQRQSAVQKPTVEVPLRVLRRLPPSTFAELLNSVDLAVHVNILSSEPRVRQIPGGVDRMTLFVAEIVERGRQRRFVRPGQKIRILQAGGVFEESDKIVKLSDENHPPLAAGRSYLLTLDWRDDVDAYVLAYGPDSVFEIEKGKVFPRTTTPAVRGFRGKDLKEAIQRVK